MTFVMLSVFRMFTRFFMPIVEWVMFIFCMVTMLRRIMVITIFIDVFGMNSIYVIVSIPRVLFTLHLLFISSLFDFDHFHDVLSFSAQQFQHFLHLVTGIISLRSELLTEFLFMLLNILIQLFKLI